MKPSVSTLVVLASITIATISIVLLVYVYGLYQKTQTRNGTSVEVTNQEVLSLVRTIEQFMELPMGESPNIATVSDISKLGGNPFFANAKNGDKVLIYPKALKAILYRPSTKKVVEVSVFSPSVQENVTNTSATLASTKMTIAIRNGTTTVNLPVLYEKELKAKFPDAVVVDTGNAKRRDYTDTMIIDLTRIHKTEVETIANTLDIAVGQLPSGEATTSASYLIILGSDKSK
jgi:hypothetical protein